MSTSASLAYFVRTAIGSMVRSPFVHVIAVAALGLALVGFGMTRIAANQLDALLSSLGGEVEFTVYLAPDAPADQVDSLEKALVGRTQGTLTRISPATALGRLAAQLGEQGKSLTELGDNPLPWSLELKLPPHSREPAALKDLAERTRALPFVTGVDYGEEALERLGVISRALRLAGLVAFVLVFLTTVIVVSATLQLAIFARREEIEIQKLVGGTDTFVRMPFLIEGALQGLFSGGFALAAVYALVRWVEKDGGELVGFLMLDGRFVVAWGRLALEQVGLGVLLGLTGSFIAVREIPAGMTALLLALLLHAGSDVEDEHAQLEARLAAEKTAFDAIGDEKKDLLSLLDTLERLSRESSQRAAALERNVARVSRQVSEARKDAEVVQAELVAQQRRIAPRLVTLYRLQKQDSLGVLLSAGDFASLIKRQRAFSTLVSSDVRELDDLAVFASWQRRQARRLERLEATGQRYLRALRTEQAVGQVRMTRFKDLLASVGAEQNRMSRLIAELEQTEKELAGMVNDMQSTVGSSAFRARKGQLPYPTAGNVEVGFGKVVNPRFNTVTVQKGIDIRAAEGAPVITIGTGTVVFSGWLKGYGNLVIVDHGSNFHSLYAHLSNSQVDVGNAVEEGETIGQVGDTGSLKGSYLYFEIRKGGQAVDPLPWLKPEE